MRTDTGVKADTAYDGFWVKALHLSVGIELVEVADTQSQIGVGKEFHGLCLFHAHEQGVDVFLLCTLLQKFGKHLGIRLGIGIADGSNGSILFREVVVANLNGFGITYDDARGVEVIIQRFALTQELGREEQIELFALQFRFIEELQRVFCIKAAAIAHGDGTLDDHHGIRVNADDQVDDVLYMMCVEEILDGVVVGRCCDDYEVRVAIGTGTVERGFQIKLLLCQILFNILVLDG